MDADQRASLAKPLDVVEVATMLEKQAIQLDSDLSRRGEAEPLKEVEAEKAKAAAKKPEPKSSTKKSSRFFSASYFSSGDEAEFSPTMVFSELAMSARAQLGKVVIGMALLLAGYVHLLIFMRDFYFNTAGHVTEKVHVSIDWNCFPYFADTFFTIISTYFLELIAISWG